MIATLSFDLSNSAEKTLYEAFFKIKDLSSIIIDTVCLLKELKEKHADNSDVKNVVNEIDGDIDDMFTTDLDFSEIQKIISASDHLEKELWEDKCRRYREE